MLKPWPCYGLLQIGLRTLVSFAFYPAEDLSTLQGSVIPRKVSCAAVDVSDGGPCKLHHHEHGAGVVLLSITPAKTESITGCRLRNACSYGALQLSSVAGQRLHLNEFLPCRLSKESQ
jgi:hypothetical protein